MSSRPRRAATCGAFKRPLPGTDAFASRRTLANSRDVHEPARAREHGAPHRGRELPRLRVLPARVEAREQRHAVGQPGFRTVREARPLARREPVPPPARLEPRLVADAPE